MEWEILQYYPWQPEIVGLYFMETIAHKVEKYNCKTSLNIVGSKSEPVLELNEASNVTGDFISPKRQKARYGGPMGKASHFTSV